MLATEHTRRANRRKGDGMKYKCKRCGHEWYGRNKTPPKACARCKSYRWNQPKKESK